MATFIEAGDGLPWVTHFPEVAKNESKRVDLNSALMLLAAWMTRGNVSAKVAAQRILANWWTHDNKMPSRKNMISYGRISWYITKVVETKPVASRSHGAR